MSSDVSIRIEGLGKAFQIRHREQQVTLAEQLLDKVRHPFSRAPTETFWALRDVDLEVSHGEVLGLVGRNGAGKSTLLKVLSRITAPTKGRVELFGRVGSLLEVGTGFHPELTGRENIFLNGAILGMRTAEVQRQFDAIVDFAGVERFLDTPVKRYSSGMYVRLAFAVAAHMETEILLVDEVLAVGDGEFQEKCIGKMGAVAGTGRTVVFVSHNLAVIRALCPNAVLLDSGSVSIAGETEVVIRRYQNEATRGGSVQLFTDNDRWQPSSLPRDVLVTRAELLTETAGHVTFREPIRLRLCIEPQPSFAARPLVVLLAVSSIDGTAIMTGITRPFSVERDRVDIEIELTNPGLVGGRYSFEISLGDGDEFGLYKHSDVVVKALPFDVQPPSRPGGGSASYWPPTWGRMNVGPARLRIAETSSSRAQG